MLNRERYKSRCSVGFCPLIWPFGCCPKLLLLNRFRYSVSTSLMMLYRKILISKIYTFVCFFFSYYINRVLNCFSKYRKKYLWISEILYNRPENQIVNVIFSLILNCVNYCIAILKCIVNIVLISVPLKCLKIFSKISLLYFFYCFIRYLCEHNRIIDNDDVAISFPLWNFPPFSWPQFWEKFFYRSKDNLALQNSLDIEKICFYIDRISDRYK